MGEIARTKPSAHVRAAMDAADRAELDRLRAEVERLQAPGSAYDLGQQRQSDADTAAMDRLRARLGSTAAALDKARERIAELEVERDRARERAAEWEARYMRHGNKILAMARDEKELLTKLVAAEATVGRVLAELEAEAAARAGSPWPVGIGERSGLLMAIDRFRAALDAAGTPAETSPTGPPVT